MVCCGLTACASGGSHTKESSHDLIATHEKKKAQIKETHNNPSPKTSSAHQKLPPQPMPVNDAQLKRDNAKTQAKPLIDKKINETPSSGLSLRSGRLGLFLPAGYAITHRVDANHTLEILSPLQRDGSIKRGEKPAQSTKVKALVLFESEDLESSIIDVVDEPLRKALALQLQLMASDLKVTSRRAEISSRGMRGIDAWVNDANFDTTPNRLVWRAYLKANGEGKRLVILSLESETSNVLNTLYERVVDSLRFQ